MSKIEPAADFHAQLAGEMRYVQLKSAELPGVEKKALVIAGLQATGMLPKDGSDPLVVAAEVAIDALIWAIRHKAELSLFLAKNCCCCG